MQSQFNNVGLPMLSKHDAFAIRVGRCYIVLFSWMCVNGPTVDIVIMQTTPKKDLY